MIAIADLKTGKIKVIRGKLVAVSWKVNAGEN